MGRGWGLGAKEKLEHLLPLAPPGGKPGVRSDDRTLALLSDDRGVLGSRDFIKTRCHADAVAIGGTS